ncbi:FibroRumin system radical SAM peptide maturase [Thiorhodovibrio frisius]|uniref:Radical SAM additional 4Fe4S-binding domain protein n=1 Tax=Thiorhodovibrio frisius TaxID=631362 RepID=H8YW28_9GAMM|nr:FibroRumin system radical SAM peptide maturase [Thiorhodovibrio frisius]EIC23819.1 radical SAM additional 4Fe4S-binding domain protein [Thiorhodovibrio frisius]WPL22996.1 Anaerobic sulfatase-maturating enzyme [Thiorhodovibrio frisius]
MNIAENIPTHLFFSKYAHKLERNGIFAYFHALRMKPVFISAEMESTIEMIRLSKDARNVIASITNPSYQESVVSAISALIENKVITKNPDVDKKVITHFRSSIPPAYTQIAYFILTENCNFGCSYCFVKRDGETRSGARVMSPETAIKGLELFCKLVAMDKGRFEEEKNIIFYGGEPLLNITVLQIISKKVREYKSCGKLPQDTRLSIVTNGSLLTEDNIDLLSSNNVAIGISLDGDECATNSCRAYTGGGPVYHDIIKGIERCKAKNIPFSLSVTLTEQSVKNFNSTLSELKQIGSNALGFNILLTDEQFRVFEGYNEAAADCILTGFEEFRRNGVYEDRMMRKLKSFAESRVYLFDCGAAGASQIVVAPDGDLGICHGFLGSRENFPTNVDNMDFDPSTDPTFLEWRKRTPLNMPDCENCMALGICGGGCPLNALKNTGSIWGLDERFCVHSIKTLQWLVWDLFAQVTKSGN